MQGQPAEAERSVLVLGPRGLIGRAVVAEARNRGLRVHAWGRSRMNLRTPAAWPALPSGIDAVLNCAGYTAVDQAERDEREAMAVNATAAGRLAERCRDGGALLVHLSAPEVFAGDDPRPYAVDAPHAPVNAYGRSKAAGEVRVAASGARFACVRPGWVYGAWGHHYVRSVRRQLSARDTIEAVTDRTGQPTAVLGLAAFLLDLVNRNATGTFHHADAGAATRLELARAVAEHAGRGDDVRPVTTARFDRLAPRMVSAVLDLSATEQSFGPRRPWREPLREVLDELDRGDPVESAARRG